MTKRIQRHRTFELLSTPYFDRIIYPVHTEKTLAREERYKSTDRNFDGAAYLCNIPWIEMRWNEFIRFYKIIKYSFEKPSPPAKESLHIHPRIRHCVSTNSALAVCLLCNPWQSAAASRCVSATSWFVNALGLSCSFCLKSQRALMVNPPCFGWFPVLSSSASHTSYAVSVSSCSGNLIQNHVRLQSFAIVN